MSAPVKVKPLVWSHLRSEWHGRCSSGNLIASIHYQSDSGYTVVVAPAFLCLGATSLLAAQEMAQAHWDAFIRAAIEGEESPSPAAFDCGHLKAFSVESIYPREDGGTQCTVCANHMRGFPH